MTPSSRSANAVRPPTTPTPTLEARLRALIAQTLGIDADHLVGYLPSIDDLAGEPDLPPVRARAWLGSAAMRGPRLGRTFRLDRYTLQVLIDDARRMGRGARLDVVVARDTPVSLIGAIRRRLAALGRRGIDVRVRVERRRRDYSFLFPPPGDRP
jgi:hypothetical protein